MKMLHFLIKYRTFAAPKLPLLFILGLLLFIPLNSCKTYMQRVTEETHKSYDIRVKLKIGSIFKIPFRQDIVIQDYISKKTYSFPETVEEILIARVDGRPVINGRAFQGPLLIFSKKNMLIGINDRQYFGKLKIVPTVSGLEVINQVPLETYLISVLPSEVPAYFHPEALKVQAIVARTYSFYFISHYSRERNFDVDDTTSYQVYKGHNLFLKNREVKKIIKAIKDTEGMIITYGSDPIIAYFHSNSGGLLKSGFEYFGKGSDFPYLTSKEDPYSLNYPGSTWEYSIQSNDFLSLLQISSFSDLRTAGDSQGFIKKVLYKGKELSAKQLRRLIGYEKIRSERFSLEIIGDTVRFTGIGYGHGVGLSQWGAQGMAKKGFKFHQIIDFYYPGTTIEYF